MVMNAQQDDRQSCGLTVAELREEQEKAFPYGRRAGLAAAHAAVQSLLGGDR